MPASKSQTIRALLIASAASGTSILRNPLDSQDTRSCIAFCRSLGAEVRQYPGRWEVDGSAFLAGRSRAQSEPTACSAADSEPDRKLPALPPVIDTGNSGTTICLGSGFAAALGYPVILTGDSQIRSRPIGNLAAALQDLGAEVSFTVPDALQLPAAAAPGSPPLLISGPLKGGRTAIACPTSQYLSALLLAAPLAEGPVEIEVTLLNEAPYAALTVEWLEKQAIRFTRTGLTHFSFPGPQSYQPFDELIPGDYSSASFFFCAAAVTGTRLTLRGLHEHDSQGDRQILGWLARMGCRIEWRGGAVTVTGPAPGTLRGIDIDLNSAPDALPILAAAGCFAEGTTRLLNVPQARIKETDRIAVMARELGSLGAVVAELEDGLVIEGGGLAGGRVSGHDDHRVIMALAIAGLAASAPVTIEGVDAAGVTFPEFFELLGHIAPGSVD